MNPLEIEADALAKRYDLDARRVRQVFEDLATVEWLAPSFPFNTALHEAISFVGTSNALEMFESEDLQDLAQNVALVDYLGHPATPFYTLAELGGLLQDFAAFLNRNIDHLLKTGYPDTAPPISLWLDLRLTGLLPVKEPLIAPGASRASASGHSTRLVPAGDGERKFEYQWTTETPSAGSSVPLAEGELHLPGGFWWREGIPHLDDGRPVALCDYGEAALLAGLSHAEAERLVELREPLLRAKLGVLEVLTEAVRERDQDRVWPAALNAITRWIPASDAEFILDTSRAVGESRYAHELLFFSGLRPFVSHRGGLRDLLELIGHCQKEIATGSLSQTATAFADLPPDGGFSSYYEAVCLPSRDVADEILDRCLLLEGREEDFWRDYKRRVDRALAEDFYEDVTIQTRVRRKDIPKFEPLVRTFADHWRALLDAGEIPGGFETPAVAAGPAAATDGLASPAPVELTPNEQAESIRHGFNSQLHIHVTGLRRKRKQNLIKVEGSRGRVSLPDASFKGFLFLVVRLCEGGDGWVDRISLRTGEGLADEGTYFPRGIDQELYRMRSCFGPALGGLEATDFIEASGQGAIRLSTHPRYVTWDREALQEHPDKAIRELAEQLPEPKT